MNDLIDNCKISGNVLLDGRDILFRKRDISFAEEKGWEWSFRNQILFPMSIFDNAAYGPRLHGV